MRRARASVWCGRPTALSIRATRTDQGRARRPHHTAIAVAALLLLSGCATARSQFGVPSRDDWKRAVGAALRDPDTWIPAVTAVAVAAVGVDEDVSDWAREQTPIFGSVHRAESASDELKGASHVLMFATAVPPAGVPDRWTIVALDALEEEAIVATVGAVTLGAKKAADRERPDGSNRASFPSGHSSGSSATGALARENLARSAIPSRWHPAIRVGTRVIHGATAWARIEAGKHYPTDVLAGSALGNLLAVTLDRALRDRRDVSVSIGPSRGGIFLSARVRF